MDISKLGNELKEASAQRSSDELDRMIAIHQNRHDKKKEKIKRYLFEVATVADKKLSYEENNTSWVNLGSPSGSLLTMNNTTTGLSLSDVYDLVEEQNAVAALVNLKAELQ